MSNTIRPDFIPTIGVAQMIGSVNVVTLRCVCPKKEILMGQMGVPIVCPTCKKTWFVSATAQIKVQEVLIDTNAFSPV